MIKDLLKEILDLFYGLLEREEIWFFLFLIFLLGYFSFNYFNLEIKPQSFYSFLEYFLHFVKKIWFFWLFFILFFISREIWLFYRQELFKKSIERVILEIKIPQQNFKNPKAMEQFLIALHSLRNAPSGIKGKWLTGEITHWFTLEIASFGGQIHFYISCYKKYKELLTSSFFSVYPEAEMVEVGDYFKNIACNLDELYKKKLDLWGTEVFLTKPSYYPIKSYSYFVEANRMEKNLDPLSSLLEILGNLKQEEIVSIQILIWPIGNEWLKPWEFEINKMKEKAKSLPTEIQFLKELENNLSKPFFKTIIRFIYLAPKDSFYESFVQKGFFSFLSQFSDRNLNSFRQNQKINTRAVSGFSYLFSNLRKEYKKARLLRNFCLRDIPPETFFGKLLTSKLFNLNFYSKPFEFSVESLATIFHLPTETVLTTPYFRKLEAKKVSPPIGLDIFGEENELNKFY